MAAPSSSPRRTSGPHRRALTRMLRATGLVHVPEEAPLVELLRTLATELDEGGGSRPQLAYLSALKDVRRVLTYSAGRPTSSSDVPPVVKDDPDDPASESGSAEQPNVNSLALFKQERGIA